MWLRYSLGFFSSYFFAYSLGTGADQGSTIEAATIGPCGSVSLICTVYLSSALTPGIGPPLPNFIPSTDFR